MLTGPSWSSTRLSGSVWTTTSWPPLAIRPRAGRSLCDIALSAGHEHRVRADLQEAGRRHYPAARGPRPGMRNRISSLARAHALDLPGETPCRRSLEESAHRTKSPRARVVRRTGDAPGGQADEGQQTGHRDIEQAPDQRRWATPLAAAETASARLVAGHPKDVRTACPTSAGGAPIPSERRRLHSPALTLVTG